MKGQILVVDKYRSPRANGTYNKEDAKLVRKGMKVSIGNYEDVNDSFKGNGVFYKLDEKATEQRDAYVEENFETKKLKSQAKILSAESIVDALVSKSKTKEVVIPDGEPTDKWTKDQLSMYCEENNIEFNKQLGAKKLLELIKNQ